MDDYIGLSNADTNILRKFSNGPLPPNEKDKREARLIQTGYLEPAESKMIEIGEWDYKQIVLAYRLSLKGEDALSKKYEFDKRESEKRAQDALNKGEVERKEIKNFRYQFIIGIVSAIVGAVVGLMIEHFLDIFGLILSLLGK